MRVLALILVALVAAEREKKNGGLGNTKKKCGTQTIEGSKCLSKCLQTAQVCVLQVGNELSELQKCVMDDKSEKTEECRKCVDELKANNCGEFFSELQAQGKDKNTKEALTPAGFKQLCGKIGPKDKNCLLSGCYTNKRGCKAKLSKTNCNRIQRPEICEAVPGCQKRKVQKKKKGKDEKEKVCKGKVDWALTGRR